MARKPNTNLPILDDDGKPSEVGFEGFVNPNQKQSLLYGPKTKGQGPKRCAKPGDPVTLTVIEFDKLKKKGLTALLVKTLPRTIAAEPADPNPGKTQKELDAEALAELNDKEAADAKKK